MIENFEKSSKYAQNLFKINDKKILEIEKESLENNVPIITREVLNYMLFEAKRINAKNILEIGSATGYSGLFLANVANANGGKLTTIEIDEIRHKKAKENFEKLNILKENSLILGDALEEIPKLNKNEKYDFIFIDASKGQYKRFFEMCYELLSNNGTIFIDNIMFRGIVTENNEENGEIPKRFKTIVKRLDEFINELNDKYNFVLLPFGDGVGLVRK